MPLTLSFPRLQKFIMVSSWVAIGGAVLVIAGIAVGILTHSSLAAGELWIVGAMAFAFGLVGRWRGGQYLTKLRQMATAGPVYPKDVWALFNPRQDLVLGLIYGLVVAAGFIAVVVLMTRH